MDSTKRVLLVRIKQIGDETLGEIIVYSGLIRQWSCKTLEPAWKNNEKNVSCIPEGHYTLVPRESEKYGKHLLVSGTNPRDLILVHVGNFRSDTEGCICVGDFFADINRDGKTDITDSLLTLKSLLVLIPTPTPLTIVSL